MGRKRKYASDAEKQAAYRARNNVTRTKAPAAAGPVKRVTKSIRQRPAAASVPRVTLSRKKVKDYGSVTKKCKICGVQNYYQICRRKDNPHRWFTTRSLSWFPRIRRLRALIDAGRLYPIEWARFWGDTCDFCLNHR